jgi:hypothetical protein
MSKYGEVAVRAVRLVGQMRLEPLAAWKRATAEIFPDSIDCQVKGCPKGAFLGLCEEGLVIGVRPGDYTTSKKNKSYAVKAVSVLRRTPGLADDRGSLWLAALDSAEPKRHNGQMDVVVALWRAGLIARFGPQRMHPSL